MGAFVAQEGKQARNSIPNTAAGDERRQLHGRNEKAQVTEYETTHRLRAPVLLAGAPALVRPEVVQDARPLEEQRALGALLVGVEGVPPLETDPYLGDRS